MQTPPDDTGKSRDQAVRLYSAYLRASHQGQAPDFKKWCQDHAEEAEGLEALHELVTLAGALTTARSLPALLTQHYGEEAFVTVTLFDEDSEETRSGGSKDRVPAQPAGGLSATERYALEGEVGRGGMGVVYRIRDRRLNRTLAMKLRSAGSDTPTNASERIGLARFLEEAQVTAQLDHPGIVAVHDLGVDEAGHLFFTMKLVKGRDLGKVIEQARRGEGGWNLSRAVGVLVKACQALAYAHSKGVIHRDLKPTNIMVGRFGEVYVMDWGLAKVLGQKDLHDLRLSMSSGVTQTSIRSDRESTAASTPESPLITMDGSVVGTPAYMSLEQALGKVDEVEAPADVYSMGAILYNLLTGQAPYVVPGARISPHTILGMVIQGPPKPVAALDPKAPAELVAICERAMARDKVRRYRNCSELAEDLQAFLDHRVVQAYRTGAVAELRSWVSRNRLTATVGVASMVLALIGVGAWSLWQRETALRAKEELARAYLRQGQAMCQAGDVHTGVHLMVQALNECPARLPALAGVIQRNVLDWGERGARLLHVFEHAPVDPSGRTYPNLSSPAFAVRPDGAQLASAGAGSKNVRIWSLQTGEPVGKPLAHPAVVDLLVYAEGGRTLVTGCEDGSIRRWTLEGEPLGKPIQLGDDVNALARLPGHDLLVAGFTNGSINVVSAKGKLSSHVIHKGTNGVTALALAANGQRLVAGFRDGTALVLPIEGGEPSRLDVPPGAAIVSATFSPDGDVLAMGRNDGEVRFYALDTGRALGKVMRHSAAVHRLEFSPDSRLLSAAVVPGGDNSVQLWSVPDGDPAGEPLVHQSWVPATGFGPDGRMLATGGLDFYCRLWSVPTGRPLSAGIPHRGAVGQLAFTRDGSRLVVSSMGEVEVWAVPTERPPDHSLNTECRELWATDFSPDGTRVLLAGTDGPAQIWSTKTFQLEFQLPAVRWAWNALFSPDGRSLFAVGGGDLGMAQLWTVQGELVRNFDASGRDPFPVLRLAPGWQACGDWGFPEAGVGLPGRDGEAAVGAGASRYCGGSQV
jgi:serine/threonine protein kinase/WD40 repeat protein